MRKALGLVLLGCSLAVAFACSPGASSPTQPAALSAPNLQVAIGEVSVAKQFICHRNFSDPFGVVTEVTGQTTKRHSKHLTSQQDCIWLPGDYCGQGGDICDPTASSWGGSYYICNATC